MKTNHFKPFDDVADSMANAAARIGVPIEVIREAKRNGSSAFRGSRVDLTQLREEIASASKGPSTSDVLLMIVEEVAGIVASKLPHTDAVFKSDSCRITEAIHNGFACALVVVEPDSVDQFLKKSAALMENIFKIGSEKLPRVDQPKNNGSGEATQNRKETK